MKNIHYIFSIIIIIALQGCSIKEQNQTIVNPRDYSIYLNRNTNNDLKKCNEEMNFWFERLAEVPTSETYRLKLAALYSSRFMLNGKVEDVKSSDSIYHLIQINTTQKYASLHRSLAANCITQHKFREAYEHITEALTIGEGKASSLYMLTDVNLELGDYKGAKSALKKIQSRNIFPYLIRKAKIKDHEGNLDSAIILMEVALKKVKENQGLLIWTKSNLADMYGHAGRVQEAYDTYVSILKNNPDYDYALKGIAWIAYSHDHNYAEAKRIINYIETKRATPDMHLFLAKIAASEGNEVERKIQLTLFTTEAYNAKYGDMYNKYLALLESEELINYDKTIEIAKIEIANRPTAQSYDLLAWGHFKKGDIKQALTIVKEHVENKTFEPDVMYHLGMIYKANGLVQDAEVCFEQAAKSSFELGPDIAKKIHDELKS